MNDDITSDEYREQIRQEVERELGGRQMDMAPGGGPSLEEQAERWLATLADPQQSARSRKAALRSLQQLAFNPEVFADIRPRFIEILRGVIEDPDPELRTMALETLMQEKDEYAQRRLLAGLERKEEPLVDDETAILLLAYDIHADHFPVMRELARNSPDAGTRREAVKVLSADTQAGGLLLDIFDDKGEDASVRRAASSALMSVDPAKFEERAKQAVLDESDQDSVRAASLTALAFFANPTAISTDAEFIDGVSKVDKRLPPEGAQSDLGGGGEGDLAKAVRLFKNRHGQ